MIEQTASPPIRPPVPGENGKGPPAAAGIAIAPPPRVHREAEESDATRSDVEATLGVGSAARRGANLRRRLLPWAVALLGILAVVVFAPDLA